MAVGSVGKGMNGLVVGLSTFQGPNWVVRGDRASRLGVRETVHGKPGTG